VNILGEFCPNVINTDPLSSTIDTVQISKDFLFETGLHIFLAKVENELKAIVIKFLLQTT